MVNIKTLNEIILSIINNIHDSLPEVDTKEGTFLRDVIIDPIGNEISNIYDDIYQMELSQSILTCTGDDLDKLASNYFIERKEGTKSYGKVRFYIKNTEQYETGEKYNDIYIPMNTMVSTEGSLENPAIQFKTIEDALVLGSTIPSLPSDGFGHKYIEILCESILTGAKNNIGPYSIVTQNGSISNDIIKISNPYSFNGGTNEEDDISLALRISLAITGSNIGTKNGYLSYILQQPQVLDAIIVGAGDTYMTRDIVKVYKDDGTYTEQHMGGKVDIYVRTNSRLEEQCSHMVSFEDLDNDYSSPQHLILDDKAYPVEKVVSILGEVVDENKNITYKPYINAGDYELEKTIDQNIERYYIDIPWDFNIKTYFPDEEYHITPIDLTNDEIIRLKTKLDNELLTLFNNIENISYKIDWDVIRWVNPNIDNVTLFEIGQYTDNLYYKIRTTTNTDDGTVLGIREFIKKDDIIYVRIFITPDFKLVRVDDDYEGSIRALDYIKWLSNAQNLPEINEKLVIKYICNNGIRELQEGIEVKRVMTADVLVKAAKQKDIEIQINTYCSKTYDPITVKQRISDALAHYINNEKKLGDYVDKSDIVYIIKSIDGVTSIDIDSVKLSIIGMIPSQIISCNPNEFFNLKNLIINVSNALII